MASMPYVWGLPTWTRSCWKSSGSVTFIRVFWTVYRNPHLRSPGIRSLIILHLKSSLMTNKFSAAFVGSPSIPLIDNAALSGGTSEGTEQGKWEDPVWLLPEIFDAFESYEVYYSKLPISQLPPLAVAVQSQVNGTE
ncbi:hypothetical protein D9757_004575 [Collybiopsis confluens]|uniref:Uncharacterized protein n=1 Tax=Collybiopsis confluens TaxID=2823264 RepID=A0A8H5HWE1_9AGAR|nr:hypothetical protein D9757_004575 [Collybiopsis confluens]